MGSLVKKFKVFVTTDDPRYQGEPQMVEYFGVTKHAVKNRLQERFGPKAKIKFAREK